MKARATIVVLGIAALSAAAMLVGAAAGRGTEHATAALPTPPIDLGSKCGESVGDDGLGEVQLSEPLTVRGPLRLGVPCRIELRRGSSLTFDHATLHSSFLYVVDDSPNGPTPVEILDSELSGTGGGFVVDLRDRDDYFTVSDSTIDYALGMIVTVTGLTHGGGRLRLERSTIRAMEDGGQGVALMASENGGEATVVDVNIDVAGDVPAFVFADRCHSESSVGPAPTCAP